MGLDTPFHPEQYPGAINYYGFYKIQRNSKTILVNILRNFFSEKSQLYKITMPEIVDKLVDVDNPKLFVERNFPFIERKLPIIATAIKQSKEKKAYVGADNLLYPEIITSTGYTTITSTGYSIAYTSTGYYPTETSTGYTSTGYYLKSTDVTYTVENDKYRTGYNVYAGMSDIDVTFIIAALSPEERMELVELVNMCFTHYYRWQYFYYDEENNMFNLTPSMTELSFGGESEVKDTSNMSLIYVTTVAMKCRVEYTFKDLASRYQEIKYYEIDASSGVAEL
jgi:hypothetical protein